MSLARKYQQQFQSLIKIIKIKPLEDLKSNESLIVYTRSFSYARTSVHAYGNWSVLSYMN